MGEEKKKEILYVWVFCCGFVAMFYMFTTALILTFDPLVSYPESGVSDLGQVGLIQDGRIGSKVGQIGPQIGQIRDFFRSEFSTFGSMTIPARDISGTI